MWVNLPSDPVGGSSLDESNPFPLRESRGRPSPEKHPIPAASFLRELVHHRLREIAITGQTDIVRLRSAPLVAVQIGLLPDETVVGDRVTKDQILPLRSRRGQIPHLEAVLFLVVQHRSARRGNDLTRFGLPRPV